MAHCRKSAQNNCVKIARAIAKYGKNNFSIHCLTVYHTQEIADYWETYFIDKFDSIKRGYNILRNGFSRKGTQHSNDTKQQMSVSRRGEKNANVKLTKLQIIAIRKEYKEYSMPNHIERPKYGAFTSIARKYGVSPSCIKDIISGKNWK
jgi:group I intron endonuclease